MDGPFSTPTKLQKCVNQLRADGMDVHVVKSFNESSQEWCGELGYLSQYAHLLKKTK